MSSDRPTQVRRRRVFYIPGYDPVHPRRYRELYRKEGAEQAEGAGEIDQDTNECLDSETLASSENNIDANGESNE